MSFDALPAILQIALFGAAGTSFVMAHLKYEAARKANGDVAPADRWRIFRFPHLERDTPECRKHRFAGALQTAYGFTFLLGAILTPVIARLFAGPPA